MKRMKDKRPTNVIKFIRNTHVLRERKILKKGERERGKREKERLRKREKKIEMREERD